ncbi:MAG: CBS domain-containing protein [Thermoleophilia bacterium]|nr:CBS domain-containing protein [Thermoleophilia bacterium]
MTTDDRTKVLIAGGGVAALEAALTLRALAPDRVEVELLAPEPHFFYRPLAVAEPFALGEVRRFELAELAAEAGAAFTLGRLVGVDADRRLAHVATGGAIPYDALLVASGAVPVAAVRGALTFRGPADTERVSALLDELASGSVERVAFAVPWGATWSLPAYELALLTAAHLGSHGLAGVELALVTPEDEPLQLFGLAAVEAMRALLEANGIAVHTGVHPLEAAAGELRLLPEGVVPADRVVALPRLAGQRLDGLPQTHDGFLPVDEYGRVRGVDGVFAAGDATSFPVKQGGVAAQQAEVAASTIAAAAGARVAPRSFRPVLRGMLLTGAEPRYLRRELAGGSGESSGVSVEPLWWPPAKIVGRYLAPFLAARAGEASPPGERAAPARSLPVEVELDAETVARLRSRRLEPAGEDEALVGEEMGAEPVAVAPDATLAEAAARLRERDAGSAVVVEGGRLVGVLTSRDVLRAVAARVHAGEARVCEWMTAEPVAVSPRTTLGAAAALMSEFGFHHLPVVEGERVVGMLGIRQAVRRARTRVPVGLGL